MIRLLAFVVLLAVLVVVVARLARSVRLVPMATEERSPRHDSRTGAERLRTHVETLCVTYGPRTYRDRDNQARIVAYIRRELAEAGATVHEQPFNADGVQYTNVVARLGPDTQERIVLGAHYDAVSGTPGADDNASGVALLIEAARALSREKLGVRVDLVAFANEEPPFFGGDGMGSAAHARSLRQAGAEVRAMLALEMVGYYSDEPGTQDYPSDELARAYGPRGNFAVVAGRPADKKLIEAVAAAMNRAGGVQVHTIAAPEVVPGIGLSDHSSYWKQRYPAAMLTDSAFYRNPNYHTANDTPDTLDYARMDKLVGQLAAAVLELSR